MSELVRALIVAGLMSGTQPITIMGLLIVMTGAKGTRNSWAFLGGAFAVETLLLLAAALFLGDTVQSDSEPGRVLLSIRVALGVAVLVTGLLLRRPPRKEAPETPKALQRLRDLTPGKSFVAGVLLADYVGPVIASLAIAASPVTLGGRLLAIAFYTALATGIPGAFLLVSLRSERAFGKLNSSTSWVLQHRRQLASWVAIVLGVLLIGDGTIGLLLL
jgi:Sap, sulfolipid-1-addressing protein